MRLYKTRNGKALTQLKKKTLPQNQFFFQKAPFIKNKVVSLQPFQIIKKIMRFNTYHQMQFYCENKNYNYNGGTISNEMGELYLYDLSCPSVGTVQNNCIINSILAFNKIHPPSHCKSSSYAF